MKQINLIGLIVVFFMTSTFGQAIQVGAEFEGYPPPATKPYSSWSHLFQDLEAAALFRLYSFRQSSFDLNTKSFHNFDSVLFKPSIPQGLIIDEGEDPHLNLMVLNLIQPDHRDLPFIFIEQEQLFQGNNKVNNS